MIDSRFDISFVRVTVTGSQSMGPLGITIGHDSLNSWQVLTVEFMLTFVVIFTTFATYDSNRRSFGSDSLSIGAAYLVASLTGLPASGASMNPARSLGPAFVMNRWQYHWVYWIGPLTGAIVAALIYEFIFDTKKVGTFVMDTFDDIERDSNVEDDYEDPDINKMTNHKTMYHSTSAASSGSSSGQRSNHTQHSIVSVHGPPGPHYDAYRPMIGTFTQSSTIQEVSPTIYNEPTGPTNFYQSDRSDRNGSNSNNNNNNNGSSSNSSNNGNGNGTNTFFCPPTGTTRFGHNTMRASLPHHRINYDGTVIGPVSGVNPKF
ncbi:hypothetical protein RDWZM_002017 [Blomia tropicalis]|uniref:Aquaporin n=1 Tax=Blomia tropicalis TaxID=40697 RepID=A0A9Q0MFM5_BLOTA|nr:hypothetical protein RDWZM_002017 [Blomia tropicalis]